jgi:hypothetical protein
MESEKQVRKGKNIFPKNFADKILEDRKIQNYP